MIRLKHFSYRIILGFLMALFLFTGCKGSDTREAVDDTVEELAGKKKVDQMKKMEKDVGKLQDQQADRLNQLDNIEDNH